MAGKRPRTERTRCVVVDNGRRGIDGCGSGAADRRRPRGVPILESVLLEPNVIDIMKKQIEQECGHAVCGCNVTGHTPAERKFINKMCVYVCVIAALVVFAGYALTPIDWDILIMK